MSLKLSHSSVSRYIQCPESYRLHYIEKIRSNTLSANLLFGSALDLAINTILLKEDKNPMDIFMKNWTKVLVGKAEIDLALNPLIVYSNNDLDYDLFDVNDIIKLEQLQITLDLYKDLDVISILDVCKESKKQDWQVLFHETEKVFFNYACWLSLIQKARLILKAYQDEVMPQIQEVVEIQKKVSFHNKEGDEINGIIDIRAKLNDNKEYILDNKSSSKPYKTDAVKKSEQLTLYATHEGITDAGFIVYLKNMNKKPICSKCKHIADSYRAKKCNNIIDGKRCNADFEKKPYIKADIQIILDTVDLSMTNKVMEQYVMIADKIKNKEFPKNLDSCANWYGSPCVYYNLCHKGKMEGLEKV